MHTLPKPDTHESEARSVSEILARANPAEMPAMRASLSFLTSAGAELATALARRNQEYDELLAIITVLPPEWIEAAKSGAPMPDVGGLRAELQLAKDERIDLHGQLVERERQIQALQDQLSQLQLTPPAEPAPEEAASSALDAEMLDAQLAELREELEKAALARAEAEDRLRASDGELSDIESRLIALRSELLAALPEDIKAELAATPGDEPAQDTRQRRAMRLGGLAAAVSALVERNKQADGLAGEANARVAVLEDDLGAAHAARLALEADLGEKVQSLDDLQGHVETLQSESEGLIAQIEQLKDQTGTLQAELETANAVKAAAEEQLLAREGELAELYQQIDSVGQQLRTVLPEDALADLMPVGEGAEASQEFEGDEIAMRGAAPKMLGLTALAAGVSSAVDLSSQKLSEAAEASGQLAALAEEKAALEGALHEKEQFIAELSSQIDALSAQVADAQGQIDATLAARAELEQQLDQSNWQLSELQSQVDGAVSRLLEIVPGEDLPEPEAVAESEDTAEGEGLAVKAVGLAALVGGVARLTDRGQSSVAELEGQVHSLQTALDGLGQERANLEALLVEKEQSLAGYNDYVLNLQGQVNQLSAEKYAAEADLQLRTQAQAVAEAQLDGLDVQVNDLTAQIEALTAQVGDLEAQLATGTAARAELEQRLQATQAQLEVAQTELAQIEQETERALGPRVVGLGAVSGGVAAIAALREKETELAAANEQLLTLQGQINELTAGNTQLATLQGQLDELAAAKADVEAQLAARGAEFEALAAQLSELQASRDEVVVNRDALLADLSARDAELAGLRDQLEALQAQLSGVTEERSALEAHVAQIEEVLGGVEAQRSAGLNLTAAAELSEALVNLPSIKTKAASAAIVAGVKPVLSPRIQALTDVAGIGSAYQQRLYNAGVGTYWELSSLPDEDMETVLQIPELQRARIDFEVTRGDAYKWAQETDTIGLLWDGDQVDDFEVLPGVGKTFEKRLYEAGITTYEQLLDCDVERLAGIIKPPPMREVNYQDWKERTRQLLAKRQASQPADPDQSSG
jgi:chromosome segregation ATPase